MQQTKHKILNTYDITTNPLNELLELIDVAWQEHNPFRVVTFNPEFLVAAEEDKTFQESVVSAQAIIPDGIGLVLLLKKLGIKNVKRQPGIELAWLTLKKAIRQNLPVALIGSTDEGLKGTVQKIKDELGEPNLVYSHNGFFNQAEQKQMLKVLLESQPQLVLIAMPFTRQEPFLHEAQQRGLRAVSMGIGGSFDVWAGLVERAPVGFQRVGLEWLWRVLGQPERIKRILKMAVPFSRIYFRS
jgi:exopolysaccharide biosynthesis WecB/TagA/CpsF family protein